MGQLASVLVTAFYDQLFAKLPTIDADLTGRTFLISGSNTGIGLAAAIHLARLKALHLVLAVRDLKKGAKAKEDIIAQTNFEGIIDVWELDLSKFDGVKGFAEKANTNLRRLDGAILNAGINSTRWVTTPDGYEQILQVNGIATGLLCVLLLPLLQATSRLPSPHPDASVQMLPHLTITGSEAHFLPKFREKLAPNVLEALNVTSPATLPERYGLSKLFDVFIAREIAQLPRAEGVVVNVVSPGMVRTDIWNDEINNRGKIFSSIFRSISLPTSEGALNLIYAVLTPTPPGAFIGQCQLRPKHIPSWVLTKEGLRVQKKVWDEMVDIWRGVSPDVDNIVQV
ncbi:hypothetical protein DFH07DRAFT_843487 [Mycena maculata]|uniref:Short-chain dehydrogenase/reductase family protein n=1 Tax=Mycena maculata TaxID=230809 RepID=A0AAD7I5L0_9AGAR|nr:hypothetical protein DFH07DRAFT_843487 [Mycena maculata]